MSAPTSLTESCMVFLKQVEAIPVRSTNVLSSCWHSDTQKTDGVLPKCTFNVNIKMSQMNIPVHRVGSNAFDFLQSHCTFCISTLWKGFPSQSFTSRINLSNNMALKSTIGCACKTLQYQVVQSN